MRRLRPDNLVTLRGVVQNYDLKSRTALVIRIEYCLLAEYLSVLSVNGLLIWGERKSISNFSESWGIEHPHNGAYFRLNCGIDLSMLFRGCSTL